MDMRIRGRRMLRLAAVVILGGLAAATRPAGTAAQEPPMRWDGSLEHLSGYWMGNPPSGDARMSRHPVSSDGRYFVFGADLPYAPEPPDLKVNFKRDRLTGETETFYGATMEPPVISANGSHIAFQSCERWLRDDQAPICDIYIIGSVYGPFVNASTTADGLLSDDTSEDPVLSADGRFLVFRTRSTTLLPIGTPPGQLVMRDRDLDGNGVFDEPGPDKVRIEVVSLSSGDQPGDNISGSPEVSADGRFIAFRSLASNLVFGDTNNAWDVFLRDRSAGTTKRINVGWDGQQATPVLDSPAISMNESGDFIAFATDDTYLVNPPTHGIPDTNDGLDIAVYDRVNDTLGRIDIGAGPGEQGNGHTYWPTLSADGRYISLVSTSTNVAGPPVTPGRAHVYAHDRFTQHTTRVSMNQDGSEPAADSAFAAISGDGSVVLFNSVAPLVPTANGMNAIYLAAHLEVSPSTLTIPAGGGSVTATVTAQQYVRWSAEFEEFWSVWLQHESAPYGIGNGSVSFYAYSNNEPYPRTETLSVNGAPLVVTQEAGLSLSAIAPASGPATGGTVVTLTGTGFEPGTQVYFEGYSALTEFVNATTLRATTPPHDPGTAFVYVQSPDFRYALLYEGFRYLDTTPPQIIPFVDGTQAPNGWYTSDVTINWWVDDAEGPATPGAGCAQTTLTTDTSTGGVTFTCTATSEGGTSTSSVSILRDARPPFVWVARPESTLYRLNSTDVASLSCSDSGSGLASCVATGPAGTPFDTSTPGEHTFTVTATDHVGHTTVVNRTYWVSSGACDARPEGLIAWWPGDYDYRDVIGGNDGVLTNAPFGEFAGGISRGSMRFMFPDGKWVQVGDTPALELQSAMTLSAWVFSGGTNVIGVIAGREGEYLLGRHADGRIRYSIANTNPGWGWVDTNVHVDQSLYTHLALTYDGSEIRLYKNGQVAYSRAANGEIGDALPAMNDFRIGARQDPADPSEYAGLIDNVEVAGRAFSHAEIERGFLAAPHGHCVDPSALTIESPQHAPYGQTLTNLVARLTRAGVPEPHTVVWFKFRGVSVGGYTTDENGVVLAPISLPANLAVGTYPNAVEARVDTNAVLSGSSATADFVVDKKVPAVEWNTPLPIVYGTALNGAQLNARGYTDAGLNHGNLVYSMAWGSVPNAGTHTLSVTFTPWDTAHYTAATASVSLVVNRANPLVELYGYTTQFGGTPQHVTGRVIDNGNTYPGLLPLNITYNGSPDAPVNAGTYAVLGSYPGNHNYNAATGSTTLTIEKAAATVTAAGGTVTYDGQPHGATVSATGAAGASLTPVTVTYNGSADVPVNAGTYAVHASYAGDSNYNAASATTTLAIVKAAPVVSVSGGTFTYDAAAHAATGSVTGAGGAALSPLTITYNGSPDVPVNAGSYAVLASFAGDANHDAASASATLMIAKAAATVTATGGAVTYDGEAHAASGTVTGVGGASLGSPTFTYNGSAGVPVNAGSYAVLASFAGDANYSAGAADATLTIDKAAPAVSVTGGAFTYDGAAHPATGTVTGVGGAPVGSLTFSYNGSGTAPVGAGAYDVVGSFAGNGNYASASGTATITIGRATPAVVWNQPSAIVYGTALGALQLNASSIAPGTFSYSPPAGAVLPAGAGRALVVTFTPADAANYNGASAATTIDVAPAALTIRGADAAKRFGAPLPALTAAGIGFVNGDSMASLIGTLTLATPATPQSAVGAYPIVPSGVSSPNYAIGFVNGTLTVVRGAVAVAIATSPEPSGFDQPMTFTASVGAAAPAAGAPGGTISFFDGSTLLGVAAINAGSASLTTAGLPAGTRAFVARYDGDGSFEIGSATAPHVIRDASLTPAFTITSSRNPSSSGQSVTLTANVSMPAGAVTGNVEFYSGATLLATRAISAGRATLTTTALAVGSHAITARYTGLGTTPPARSGVFVQTVGGSGWKNRSTTMALTSSANPSVLGTAIVFTATVTGSTSTKPTGRILVMVNGQVVADQAVTPGSGSTARVTVSVPGLAHGKHVVTATYQGDVNYKGSTAQVAQTVN